MKKCFMALIAAGLLFSGWATSLAATYDGTGNWDYSESGLYNNCGEQNVPYSGVITLIQNGDSATLLMQGRTLSGTVSGATYSFTDYVYEQGGYTDVAAGVTLSSDSSGSGTFAWTWSDGQLSCGGGGNFSIAKHSQAPATYDANGTWNYSTSDHWNTCGDPNEPPAQGTFTITQTGNRVTAVDNYGDDYTGWVSGSTYIFVTTYPDDGGTTSDVHTIILVSNSSGSGSCSWIWNDDYGNCNGGFNISISKQQVTNMFSPSVPFLLFENQ